MSGSWSEPVARRAIVLWERSRNFAPGSVTHPVRIRLSEAHFPAAWRAGGEWEREDILECVRWLEQRGLARITRSGRGQFATPVSASLAPEAVEEAYALVGGRSRRDHGGELMAALEVALREADGWWANYLVAAAEDVSRGQFGGLGQKAYEQDSYVAVCDALLAIPALIRGEPYEERTFSAEILGNSKRFAQIRKRVRQILLKADPHWAGRRLPNDRVLFGHYGERFKPAMTSLAAAIDVRDLARLGRFSPYAVLPDSVLLEVAAAVVERARTTSTRIILTTIENEWVFLRYLQEPEAAERIRSGGEIALYTAGAPSAGVLRFVRAARTGVELRHWGDSDVYGFRIARTLCAAARGGSLLRTEPDLIRRCARIASRPLDEAHRRELESLQASPHLDMAAGIREAITSVLTTNAWVEQEVYYALPRSQGWAAAAEPSIAPTASLQPTSNT